MKKVLFVILVCFLSSCKNSEKLSFSYIDYTFDSGWKESFSLRLTEDGTCVIADGRWEQKFYKGKVDEKILLQADSLIKALIACNPDTTYESEVADLQGYKIVSDYLDKHFYVYGGNEPKCLQDLSDFLSSLRNTELKPIDTVVKFKSRESFYSPPVKIDSASFLPPIQEIER